MLYQHGGCVFRNGTVSDALWNHIHVPNLHHNIIQALELDGQFAGQKIEQFVWVWMRVPDEFAIEFDNFNVVVINRSDKARRPRLGKWVEESWIDSDFDMVSNEVV